MDKILAVITARSGSKSVPNKNLQKIGEWSLLEWTAACLSKCSVFYRSIISTDSKDYSDAVSAYGIEAPFLRPLELANDTSKDVDVFVHLFNWLELNCEVPKWIAHFRPTTPFREPKFIDNAIKSILVKPDINEWTSFRSVHSMSESAYKFFELRDNLQLVSIFQQSPNLEVSNNPKELFPKTYVPNGYLDLINTENLRDSKIHGNRVHAIITEPTLEIDSPEDLIAANQFDLLNKKFRKALFT